MQFRSKTLAAALVAGTALAGAAHAQMAPMPTQGGGNAPAGGPMVPLAPNAGGAFPGGMPKPGMPRGGGHLPFAAGTVTAVDPATGMVTLSATFGGAAGQTVKVTGTTQITAQVEAKVSDLKVGDSVQVRGVPTGMTASQITAGEGSDSFGGGMFGGGAAKPGGAAATGMAYAQATGKIASLSPLTVTISDTVSVVLKTTPDVRVVKTVTETVGDLKVGDRVMANGQSGDDNVLTATRIRVNAENGLGGRRPSRNTDPMPMPMPTR